MPCPTPTRSRRCSGWRACRRRSRPARDGIDALLRDRGLRRTSSDQTAEALLVGAHASAVLEGSTSTLDEVRAGAGDDLAADAVRVSVHLLSLVPTLRTSPLQAFARLHALASGGAESGRPRDAEALARLQALGRLLDGTTAAPALLVAAVVHADLATAAPFPSHNGIVARAAERLVWVARGVDERSVLVPEAGHLALRAAYESNLRGYRDGGAAGVHALAEVRRRGGRQGRRGEPAGTQLSASDRRAPLAHRQCDGTRLHRRRVPPLTRKPMATRRAHSTAASGSSRWLAPCRKGRSPRGYPVRVLVFSSSTSVLRRSREAHKP